jgi:hypothetical protein
VKNPNFEIQSDQLTEVSGLRHQYAQLLWSDSTNTVDQFGRFQVISAGDNSQGLIFRSTPNNGDLGPHYEVHVTGSTVKWESVLNASFVDRPDSCTLSSPLQDGDWFGARITGTDDATVVEVFVSAAELLPDPNTWPTAVCTLEGNPLTPVNTGNRLGVRSYTSRQVGDTSVDDVCLGGF